MQKLYCPKLRIGSNKDNTFLTYLKQSSNQCVMHAKPNTLKHILIEYADLANISANGMKEQFQNIEMNNTISFLKSGEFIQKNGKKFSTRPNFFYKLFPCKKYSNISDPFNKLFLYKE